MSAEPEQMARVAALVRAGSYRTVSEFVREAVAARLEDLADERVAEQVARYCELEQEGADDDLVAAQAFGPIPRRRGRRNRR